MDALPALCTRQHIARAVGTSRRRIENLIDAGVIPPPIEGTNLWGRVIVMAALKAAGIALVGPAARETKD